MYGLIKTYKLGTPVRVITSACGTAIENVSIFVEKCLYPELLKIESRIKDASEMLTIIDSLNKSNTLTSDCRLVIFNIINICHVLIAILPSNVLMLKLQNILQQLSVGKNLGMIFLLSGHIVLMKLIYFLIT